MKNILIMILLFCPAVFALEGPDFMLMNQYYISGQETFNLGSIALDDNNFSAVFANASLYDIESLDWMFAAARYSYNNWTIHSYFRAYGINDLYESNSYSIMLSRKLSAKLSLGLGYSHQDKIYGENLYKASNDLLNFTCGYTISSFAFQAYLSNVALGDKEGFADGDPEIMLTGNWQANKALDAYMLYYRNPYGHDRLQIGQNLKLNRVFVLNAGLIGSPEVYYFGMEIVYKGFAFGYTYYDISELPDCSKITLSIR